MLVRKMAAKPIQQATHNFKKNLKTPSRRAEQAAGQRANQPVGQPTIQLLNALGHPFQPSSYHPKGKPTTDQPIRSWATGLLRPSSGERCGLTKRFGKPEMSTREQEISSQTPPPPSQPASEHASSQPAGQLGHIAERSACETN